MYNYSLTVEVHRKDSKDMSVYMPSTQFLQLTLLKRDNLHDLNK